MKSLLIASAVLLLAACTQPRDTAIPKDLSNLDSIKPALEKLTQEERELVAGYVVRHTLGAKFAAMNGGVESGGIPDGTTLGKAIDEQRQFRAEQELQEAKEKALREELETARRAAVAKMRDAVTVTLVSKRLKPEYGVSGIVLDENLEVTFGYKNNTDKEISGVKGLITVKDLFGDELSGFQISNDQTIAAGQSTTWTGSRSVKYAVGDNKDRKLADLPNDKFKVEWEPQTIIFSDGTQLTTPK